MPRLSRFGPAVAVGVALLAPFAPGARAAEPDKLLQADADTVAYVNVKQLVDSEIVKKFALEQIKQALAGQEAKKLLELMGLNPFTDIEKVWIGTSGTERADMKALAIFHGKFDPDKLLKAAEAAAQKDGDKFAIVKDGTVTLFKFQLDQGKAVYGTVVDETTVVFATEKELVSGALKQSEAQKKAPIKSELTALVKTMDEKTSAFAVSLVKGKFDNVNIPNQISDTLNLAGFEKALPKTDTLTVVMKITGDLTLEVVFGMHDEDSALDMDAGLVKVMDSLKALAPILAAADPKAKPLTEVVKTLKSTVAKKNVTLSAKITGDNLGKMINPDQ
jgi:hypothetical protein